MFVFPGFCFALYIRLFVLHCVQGRSIIFADKMKERAVFLLPTASAMWVTLLVLHDALSPEFFLPSKKSDGVDVLALSAGTSLDPALWSTGTVAMYIVPSPFTDLLNPTVPRSSRTPTGPVRPTQAGEGVVLDAAVTLASSEICALDNGSDC